MQIEKFSIQQNAPIREVFEKISNIPTIRTLFVLQGTQLVGSLTDGDIRRGFSKGLDLEAICQEFMNKEFTWLNENAISKSVIVESKRKGIQVLPVLDKAGHIVKLIDVNNYRETLPVDAVIMAGGQGKRLRPLTLDTPKPLLKVGEKPIIEYNIDRLRNFGVENLFITIRYLGNQIKEYFGDGAAKGMNIGYVEEDEPLGTIASLASISTFSQEHILVMNSDILTDLDFGEFYKHFINSGAEMAVASIPYRVTLPYGVLESEGDFLTGLQEKPTYTYYSNAGIYLLKRSVIETIPKDTFYDATDLIEQLIADGKKVFNYPILTYWLDIGKHEDFEKAQLDIKHLNL
ncbi:MAG: dTDP-glucose pyrophosphorylase [Arenicella sp.]|jgi:dTDP-glucose pyrophosphorylase